MSMIAPVVGRAYFTPGSYLTLLTAANTAYAVPYIPPRQGLTFDQIGVNVTTAGVGAGADCRFAIYLDDGKGRPGKLVADYGAVTTLTSTGAFKVDLSGSLDKPMLWGGKLYWLVSLFGTAATTQATVAALATAVVPQAVSAGLGTASIATMPSSAATAAVGLTAPSTYAGATALPDYGSSLTWSVVLNAAVPLVGLRAA
jgi:hypothetical protein